MGKRSRGALALSALVAGIGIVVTPTAGANPPPAPPALPSLTGGALAAAFDAGLPIVEATGTQKPPWYSIPTVFYRVITDRSTLSSPSTKFVVLGQRPPDTFAVAPGTFGQVGLAGPIATWDPRGIDPNVSWSFANTPAVCAADCAGVAYFSFAR
ncbi:hypothetical protein [Rhodococcus sp. NPDC127528]|uniref:hypothetical protein n=1 Tax=unclassified Rhodococcus (in: high G+C Gram-positive bacteria) TaxID=192944 RepID=UPI00363E0D43